jgi:hypothetical protein
MAKFKILPFSWKNWRSTKKPQNNRVSPSRFEPSSLEHVRSIIAWTNLVFTISQDRCFRWELRILLAPVLLYCVLGTISHLKPFLIKPVKFHLMSCKTDISELIWAKIYPCNLCRPTNTKCSQNPTTSLDNETYEHTQDKPHFPYFIRKIGPKSSIGVLFCGSKPRKWLVFLFVI